MSRRIRENQSKTRIDEIRCALFATPCAITVNNELKAPEIRFARLGANSESLHLPTTEIAVPPGSDCTSVSRKPSHILKSMGIDDNPTYSAVRFRVGRFNTEEEIDLVIARVTESVTRLRSISPLNSTKSK